MLLFEQMSTKVQSPFTSQKSMEFPKYVWGDVAATYISPETVDLSAISTKRYTERSWHFLPQALITFSVYTYVRCLLEIAAFMKKWSGFVSVPTLTLGMHSYLLFTVHELMFYAFFISVFVLIFIYSLSGTLKKFFLPKANLWRNLSQKIH